MNKKERTKQFILHFSEKNTFIKGRKKHCLEPPITASKSSVFLENLCDICDTNKNEMQDTNMLHGYSVALTTLDLRTNSLVPVCKP